VKNKTLAIIAGPTAVGKTVVTIELAKYFKTEIISCDSRQMYKELSVGTAVPGDEQLINVKHHFIHNISIHDYYNAYMFEVQALEVLEHLFIKKNIVLMTGGSGLYIDAVINGIDDLPTIEPEVRKNLLERLTKEGLASLRTELKSIDPGYYAKVDLKNPQRILKALEVSIMTGKPYSSLLTRKKKKRDFRIVLIGLNIDRNLLHTRINNRVDEMIDKGLIKEARDNYQYKGLNSLNTVGYRELFDHFDGKSSLEEAIELIKRNTRRYARRQISWFRRYKDIEWFDPNDIEEIKEFLGKSI